MLLTLARTLKLATLGLAASIASLASAQPEDVPVPADEDWKHQWTEMTFPARLGDYERRGITAFEERETNISASFYDDRTATLMTVYVYRPGNPSTAIWFDRALIAIGVPEVADRYGTVDLEDLKISTFVPSGGTKASGLAAVLSVEGNNVLSTGVALFRAGEWLVKLRVSSRRLSVAEMDQALKAAIADLPAMANVDDQPAQFVTECETIPQGTAQRVAEEDLGMLAFGQSASVAASMLPEEEQSQSEIAPEFDPNPATLFYCREGPRDRGFNVFRATDGSNRFTVAINDAGRGVDVYPDIVGNVLTQASDETVYAVRSATGMDYTLHTPWLGLPSINQVGESLNGPLIARVSRRLGEDDDTQITIGVVPE